jgi:hypothetical protein
VLNLQEDHGCISSIEAQCAHDQRISWVIKLSHYVHFISSKKGKQKKPLKEFDHLISMPLDFQPAGLSFGDTTQK